MGSVRCHSIFPGDFRTSPQRFWYGYLVPGKSDYTYPEQQDSDAAS
jgi:hypothetical protein